MVAVFTNRRVFNLTYDAQRSGYQGCLGRTYRVVGVAVYRQRGFVLYQPFRAERIYAIFIKHRRVFDQSFDTFLDYLPYRGKPFFLV